MISYLLLHCSQKLTCVYPTVENLFDKFLPVLHMLDKYNVAAKNRSAEEELVWKNSGSGGYCFAHRIK